MSEQRTEESIGCSECAALRHTQEEWEAILMELKASGVKFSAIARRHGLCPVGNDMQVLWNSHEIAQALPDRARYRPCEGERKSLGDLFRNMHALVNGFSTISVESPINQWRKLAALLVATE
jgi:hypothetical protein